MISRFFAITPDSCLLPLAKILPREAPHPDRVRRARVLIDAVAAGTHPKREPLSVARLGPDSYRIIDGNSTFHALLELGECEAVVMIVA